MPSKAIVTLIGHLGRDPEARYTPNGAMNVSFSLPTSIKRGDTETTTWWNVTVWGKQAETMLTLADKGALRKGTLVSVVGVAQQREYTNNNGELKQSLDVNASDVLILHNKEQGQNVSQQQYAGGQQAYDDLNSVPF